MGSIYIIFHNFACIWYQYATKLLLQMVAVAAELLMYCSPESPNTAWRCIDFGTDLDAQDASNLSKLVITT